jgi:cobalamin biosynthesis protein CobC
MLSSDDLDRPLLHGGNLAAARRMFPGAAEPFIDLSTGINPYPYRLPQLPAETYTRLPDPEAVTALGKIAANTYGVPSPACVVAAPGTQILLPLVAGFARPGRAAVFSPTYGEFARVAALAGHCVADVRSLADARDSQLVWIANPNNPDGRPQTRNDLLALADALRRRGGLLIVDEAFMDAGRPEESLAGDVALANIVVLRSFGKFFGLAGIRLGFALAAPQTATRISALLGPWAVSGPALAIGAKALGDTAWIEKTRSRLAKSARRLDAVLAGAGLRIVGGTSLFRLAVTPAANKLFRHLGRAGILVRSFAEHPQWLRFGLPANAKAWRRLQIASAAFRSGQ